MDKKRHGRQGFTLLEVMIVVLILSTVVVLFYQVTMQTMDASDYAAAFSDMTLGAQKAGNSIKEDLTTSKEVFQNNTRGTEYYACLQFPAEFPPLTSSLMPTIDANGAFTADTSTAAKTGNCLVFIKTEPVYTVDTRYGPTMDDDRDPAKETEPDADDVRTVRIDVYRIVVYYLTRLRGADIGDHPHGLSLIRCESPRFLDKGQIEALLGRDPLPTPTGADQATRDATLPDLKSEFIKHAMLANDEEDDEHEDVGGKNNEDPEDPFEYCWDTSAAADSAFFQLRLGAGGEYEIAPTATNLTIVMENAKHVIPNLAGKHASVLWNTWQWDGVSRKMLPQLRSPVTVPKYGWSDITGDWFPNGFEVQVIGQSGSRQVLVRLVLGKETNLHRIAAYDATTIIATRDF